MTSGMDLFDDFYIVANDRLTLYWMGDDKWSETREDAKRFLSRERALAAIKLKSYRWPNSTRRSVRVFYAAEIGVF